MNQLYCHHKFSFWANETWNFSLSMEIIALALLFIKLRLLSSSQVTRRYTISQEMQSNVVTMQCTCKASGSGRAMVVPHFGLSHHVTLKK